MKQALKVTLRLLTVAVAAVAGGLGWDRLAMFYSWPGSPGWLAWALGADGENAYDANVAEMVMLVAVVLLGVLAAIRRVRRWRDALRIQAWWN